MLATVRRYAGLPASAVQALAGLTDEIGGLLEAVPGLAGWHVIGTLDGAIVVMTGADEAALVESGRRFAAWAGRRITGFSTPLVAEVWVGDVLAASAASAERMSQASLPHQAARPRRVGPAHPTS